MDSEFIIFLHIQKCGGMTVQRMLRRQYGPSVLERGWRSLWKGESAKPLEAYTRSDRYMQGHHCFGVHRVLPKPFSYFTMLRKPIPRLVSLYNYSKRTPTAYYHEHAKKTTVDEFIAEYGLHELNNGQVRFLAGSDEDLFINRTPIGECRKELFDRAVRNMENHFFHVGILEHFDKSALLLGHKLGWSNSLYLRRNTGNYTKKESPSQSAIETARERNKWDIKLYNRYESKLKDDSESNFKERVLGAFKLKNKVYNKAIGPAYEAYAYGKALVSGNTEHPR